MAQQQQSPAILKCYNKTLKSSKQDFEDYNDPKNYSYRKFTGASHFIVDQSSSFS